MVSFPMAKLIVVVVLGLISVFFPSASEQWQDFCPGGWKGINDRCFKHFIPKKTWAQAELFCVALGGNLASVHSIEEDTFLKGLSKAAGPRDSQYWIGLTDCQEEGAWMWSDGSRVNNPLWHAGEPNNWHNEDCVLTAATAMWSDADCGRQFSFVCVKRSVPAWGW